MGDQEDVQQAQEEAQHANLMEENEIDFSLLDAPAEVPQEQGLELQLQAEMLQQEDMLQQEEMEWGEEEDP